MSTPLRSILWFAWLSSAALYGQAPMEGTGPSGPNRPRTSDETILELRESRSDLPCRVKVAEPDLGFDLALHSGYEVELPLRELVGEGNLLTVVFRVTPEKHPEEPVYFSQKWTVPPLDEKSKGSAFLRGDFILGEGEYTVDWLLRDSTERLCSAYWRVSAELRGKDHGIALNLSPASVLPGTRDLFRAAEPVERDAANPLRVQILLNVAPQSLGAAQLRPAETMVLLSVVRNIGRERRIGDFSLTAFNMEQGRILYRQNHAPAIDFPALGQAIKQTQLGTISVEKLDPQLGPAQFLVDLLKEEPSGSRPDAVIFVGSNSTPPAGAWRESLKALGEPTSPVFYLNYNADRQANPFRDLIGALVKSWRGFEYAIDKPRDIPSAWTDVMVRIIGSNSHELLPAISSEKDKSGPARATSFERQKGS